MRANIGVSRQFACNTCCVGLGVFSEPRELSAEETFESRLRCVDDSFDSIDAPSPKAESASGLPVRTPKLVLWSC